MLGAIRRSSGTLHPHFGTPSSEPRLTMLANGVSIEIWEFRPEGHARARRHKNTQARKRRPSYSPHHIILPQPSHPARNQGGLHPVALAPLTMLLSRAVVTTRDAPRSHTCALSPGTANSLRQNPVRGRDQISVVYVYVSSTSRIYAHRHYCSVAPCHMSMDHAHVVSCLSCPHVPYTSQYTSQPPKQTAFETCAARLRL